MVSREIAIVLHRIGSTKRCTTHDRYFRVLVVVIRFFLEVEFDILMNYTMCRPKSLSSSRLRSQKKNFGKNLEFELCHISFFPSFATVQPAELSFILFPPFFSTYTGTFGHFIVIITQMSNLMKSNFECILLGTKLPLFICLFLVLLRSLVFGMILELILFFFSNFKGYRNLTINNSYRYMALLCSHGSPFTFKSKRDV